MTLRELCQDVQCDACGLQEGDIVTCGGMRYYPYRYMLGCDGNGQWTHTAVLHSVMTNSVNQVKLSEVEEGNI